MLLIDLYTAVVLEATGRDTIPQSDWDGVRLYIPQSQRVHIKKNELFDDLARHKANRIFPEDLPGLRERAVMLFRPHDDARPGSAAVLEGAGLTYSMWEGYLKETSVQRVVTWLKERDIPWQVIHTSGHASAVDLQRFAAALAPRILVPIHSFETGRFAEFFANVVQRKTACGGMFDVRGEADVSKFQRRLPDKSYPALEQLSSKRAGWWPDLLSYWAPSGSSVS